MSPHHKLLTRCPSLEKTCTWESLVTNWGCKDPTDTPSAPLMSLDIWTLFPARTCMFCLCFTRTERTRNLVQWEKSAAVIWLNYWSDPGLIPALLDLPSDHHKLQDQRKPMSQCSSALYWCRLMHFPQMSCPEASAMPHLLQRANFCTPRMVRGRNQWGTNSQALLQQRKTKRDIPG